MGLGVFWFIPIKSLVEEDFLRYDPQYAAYMQRVQAHNGGLPARGTDLYSDL